MYQLFGFTTQNTMKVLYCLEELGVDYEFNFVNLFKGEQNSEEILKLNPFHKVPILKHGDFSMFESNAICRYICEQEKSELFPTEQKSKALVDQWLDFSCNHLGRRITTMFFEKIIKSQIDIPLNQETYDEAGNFAKKYLEKLETHLAGNPYLAGEKFSVADVVGFAYVEQTKAIDFSLNDYPNVVDWFNKVESRPSIAKAKARLPHE